MSDASLSTGDTSWDTDTVPGVPVSPDVPVSGGTRPTSGAERRPARSDEDTLELPVVPAAPLVDSAEPYVAPAEPYVAPAEPYVARAKAPVGPTEPPPTGSTPPPQPTGQPLGADQPVRADRQRAGRRSGAGRRPAWQLIAATVIVVVAAVSGTWLVSRGPGRTRTETGRVLTPASVQSFDPVGGSGLRQVAGGGWRTQTYRSATYGGLKSGVGLLVDLGTPQRVTAVDTVAAVPGVALELRAGDTPGAAPEGFRLATRKDPAQGPTTLLADDVGRHQYWLLWLPRLAPQGDGYAAQLDGLTLHG